MVSELAKKSAKRRQGRRGDEAMESTSGYVRNSERLLIEVVGEFADARRAIGTTLGRGQFATALAETLPAGAVSLFFLDLYQQQQTEHLLRSIGTAANAASITCLCAPDFPSEEPPDLVFFPLSHRGEAELTRDLLQQGAQRLAVGGRLVAAIDHPEDQWLHTELGKIFPKVTRRPKRDGVLYLATRPETLGKQRNFDCQFAFRDQGRLLKACSRPGVFSHRHIDPGARALINCMVVEPNQRVLDLGCGSGCVSLAAASRQPSAQVVALDTNPRATQSALRGAALNELSNLTTLLDCDGSHVEDESFDLVLANPPYFSNYRIADLFLQTARRALTPHGVVHLVTKAPDWYRERLPELFGWWTETPHRGYHVLSASPSAPAATRPPGKRKPFVRRRPL